LVKSIKKVFLPFSVPEKDRFKPFSKDMEMAAIFILAERDRKNETFQEVLRSPQDYSKGQIPSRGQHGEIF